ncbi:Xaa-Pro peptidase family protein [Leucobacter allii]|uniref:Xaa-Pro peptidase family protein n=1 Tax=Leucobacter allii TaxID=2932247 RepID=A0ABY4FKX8_9MICO|nr:Xaa-Pro peptidase family protein [Leucobacter allii]UOQ56916.1 Xaa-Pro peptidase family protein [Leucobacter allii]UOR01386.1 Xaa-Pro peptidase family protein [Leucobacter allii]
MTAALVAPAELDARLERVRAAMRGAELDGLLVADPANIFYLSGYNAWSFYTPQLLFVPLEGEPVLAMREMDALGAHRTAIRYADGVLGYPEPLVHRPDTHPMVWVAEQLRERGHARRGRIGFEGDAHFFAVRSYLALREGIPEWDLVESRELVNWVRLVKSDFEIGEMRAAGRVASAAMRAAVDAIEEGVPLYELAARVQAAQARGVAGADGDYPAIVPMFLYGDGADTPHLTWTDERFGADTAVSIELAGAHHRYHAPLARTVALGRPSPELERLAAVTVEGLDAALAVLEPGRTPADAHAAFSRVLAGHGLEKRSRLGYSIGIGFPPDWGERTVSLRADDRTELRENMTFHVIAGMWMTGYGFEASESVRVAPGGADVLTDAPRRLIVKETP